MPPKKQARQVARPSTKAPIPATTHQPSCTIPSDVVGVIAAFLPQDIALQQPLMLVSHAWHRGVIGQDGVKPKPTIRWPLHSLSERHPPSLCLTRAAGVEDVVRLVATIPHLQQFTASALNCPRFSEDPTTLLEQIDKLRHLTSLTLLDGWYLNNKGALDGFATRFHGLTALSISMCVVPNSKLVEMGKLKALVTLDISKCSFVDDDHIQTTCELQHLLPLKDTLLTLRCSDISLSHKGAPVKHIANLSALTSLDVSHCNIVDRELSHLKKLKHIKTFSCQSRGFLDVPHCITDVGAKHLKAWHPTLTALDLGGAVLHDKGLQCLWHLAKLQRLDISNNKSDHLTPQGFGH